MKIDTNHDFDSRWEFIQYVTHHSQPLVEKNELISSVCRNKKVLDLGCIDHSYQTALGLGDQWLHKQIKSVASELTGLDVLAEDAMKLKEYGFDIVAGNAENFCLNQKFDVIVAGDLIEHLSNIGMFLQCIKKHMDDNSMFIFTTPNPFNIEQSMSAVFANQISVNAQHTCWLSPHVCWELLTREGFDIKGFYWVETQYHFPLDKIVLKNAVNWISNYILKRKNLCKRDFAILAVCRT
ncbi:MAG: class I SAM-dependent methyltransferase [Planctomycetota bacterium]|jgi:2-polyprenyl-3-methyl-5-hydroxy-6-metoxy-1,4-benzoquinol methylase